MLKEKVCYTVTVIYESIPTAIMPPWAKPLDFRKFICQIPHSVGTITIAVPSLIIGWEYSFRVDKL